MIYDKYSYMVVVPAINILPKQTAKFVLFILVNLLTESIFLK